MSVGFPDSDGFSFIDRYFPDLSGIDSSTGEQTVETASQAPRGPRALLQQLHEQREGYQGGASDEEWFDSLKEQLPPALHSEHSFLLDSLKGYAWGTNAILLIQSLFELANLIAPDELRAEASTIIKGLEQRITDWDPLPVSNSGFDLLAELKKISQEPDS